MRQLYVSDSEKAHMLDIIISNVVEEYSSHPPVEKKYRSRAEKVGYQLITDLESNGFITTKGILGQEKSR